jgi:tetratricopeptide (TPR) repeat protein
MKNKLPILITLFFISFTSLGQTNATNSLVIALRKSNSDTAKVNLLCKISAVYYFQSNDSLARINAKKFAEEAFIKSKKINYEYGLANSYYHMANADYNLLKYADALENYHQSLLKAESLQLDELSANNLNKIGYIHCFLIKNYNKSLEYFHRALAIRVKLNQQKTIAKTLTNIANAHALQKNIDSSLNYLMKAYQIAKDLIDSTTLQVITGNIGDQYMALKQYHKAIKYVNYSKNIAELKNSKLGLAYSFDRLARIYYNLNELKSAKEYSENALTLSLKNKESTISLNSYDNLSNVYKKLGKKEEANHYKFEFLLLKDSIQNSESKNAITQQENERELKIYELKKENELRITKLQNQEDLKRSRIIFVSILFILVLFIIFLIIVLNRLKFIKQQNQTIQKQKLEVESKNITIEEKQKEILDSIRYAKRIQSAHLPNVQQIKKMMKINN